MESETLNRQLRIERWNQAALSASCVAVLGRDWAGTFAVWALRSLGVGHVLWIGEPREATEPLARRLIDARATDASPIVLEYPFDLESAGELNWATNNGGGVLILACTEDVVAQAVAAGFAGARGLTFIAGTTRDGGWIGSTLPPGLDGGAQEPVCSMALAALMVEAARERINPLFGEKGAIPEGRLEIAPPRPPAASHAPPDPGLAVLVGAGGIGCYAATLAAASGFKLLVVDKDRVELSNLNRQGLFTLEDVMGGARKAEALAGAIGGLFPGARVASENREVTPHWAPPIEAKDRTVILSAVDNAWSRLAIQGVGERFGAPVVQAGTDTFAADCFVQLPGGEALDRQMHGALSCAARRESSSSRAPGGCLGEPSYVAPSMMAGALMAFRMLDAIGGGADLAPIRWRAGFLPKTDFKPAAAFNEPSLWSATLERAGAKVKQRAASLDRR